MITLEQEFEVYKAEHKYSIALAYLIKYYTDAQETGVRLPEWMDSSNPVKKAENHLRQLYEDNKLNSFYEYAYNAISEFLN